MSPRINKLHLIITLTSPTTHTSPFHPSRGRQSAPQLRKDLVDRLVCSIKLLLQSGLDSRTLHDRHMRHHTVRIAPVPDHVACIARLGLAGRGCSAGVIISVLMMLLSLVDVASHLRGGGEGVPVRGKGYRESLCWNTIIPSKKLFTFSRSTAFFF